MKHLKIIISLALGALAIQVGQGATEFPEYGIHHITHVPITISYPGVYVVDKDLVYTPLASTNNFEKDNGTAIEINASNVSLDLQGHSLSDPTTFNVVYTSSRGIQVGIVGPAALANVLILNGTINGFAYGIFAYGTNIVVEKVAARNQENTGIQAYLIDHCQAYSPGFGPKGQILDPEYQESAGFVAWEVRDSLVEDFGTQIGMSVGHLAIGNTLQEGYIGIILGEGAAQVDDTFIGVEYPYD